jgi:beta-glucanase (GH16 family)
VTGTAARGAITAATAPPPAAAAITPGPTGQPAPTGKAVATPPANPIGDFIDGVLLMIQRLFFNQVPTAAPVQAMTRPSGQMWGFVAGRDPEGEAITYSLAGNPQSGTVTLNANGLYSYTPGAQFTGTDAFTVRIDNPGFNLNLLNLFGPQHRDVTVTIKTSTGTAAGAVVDTFDGAEGSAPDPALWGYHLGPWRDHGLQTYTDSPDNVRLDGQGNLVIQARQAEGGYTSTRLVTQDRLEMQYGVVEARIKMPAGQGIWPAFWMLGTSYYPEFWERWPECGEIDIMEVVNTGTRYNVALHGPQGDTDYFGGAEVSGQFVGRQGPIAEVAPITDLSADFHDYWLMWREDHIAIGVDDTLLADFTPASLPPGGEWVFNAPMYGILQIAVGGSWPGPPDATTPWPATMLVDSFRYTPLP